MGTGRKKHICVEKVSTDELLQSPDLYSFIHLFVHFVHLFIHSFGNWLQLTNISRKPAL